MHAAFGKEVQDFVSTSPTPPPMMKLNNFPLSARDVVYLPAIDDEKPKLM